MASLVGLETTHIPMLTDPIRNQAKQLAVIEGELKSIQETLTQLVAQPDPNSCRLRQLQIRVNHLESRLTDLMDAILLLEGKVDPLLEKGSRTRETIFDLGVRIEQMNGQASLPNKFNVHC